MKRLSKIVLNLFFAISVLTVSSNVASAAQSPWTQVEEYNRKYEFQSQVYTRTISGTTYMQAGTIIKITLGYPYASYYGAQARLYSSSGALKASSAMVHNDENISAYVVETRGYPEKGTYYSHGKAEFYNGNTGYYRTVEGVRSPYETFSLAPEPPLQVEVNEEGESFGSGLFTLDGEDPDYLIAEGIDGTEGYVRAADLASNVTTIGEALQYNSTFQPTQFIPLYDKNKNIIGQFEISTHVKKIEDLN